MCTPKENAFANNLFSLQVARQLQPSVVWIGDTEKIFYKKVPQAEKAVSAFLICIETKQDPVGLSCKQVLCVSPVFHL